MPYDVIAIGSGAGNSPIINWLAKNTTKSILILEKGPLFRPQYQDPNGVSDFRRDEMFATGPEKIINVPGASNDGTPYYNSHVEPDINDEPHVYRGTDGRDKVTIEGYTCQVVGGGTQLYGGVSLRFTERDLALATANESASLKDDPNGDIKREARDWPVTYEQMRPYYERAETLVGINGTTANQGKPFPNNCYQPPLDPNPISQYIESGMDAKGMARYRTPLAVITTDHDPSGRKMVSVPDTAKSGFVNRYGDPLGLKSNTWVSLLSPVKDRFDIWCNCIVTSLECQDSFVNQVNFLDPSGEPRTETVNPGGIVLVACSAIETVRLLKLSATLQPDFDKRINQNDLLGKYFLTHCFGGASAYVPDPERFDKSETLDSDWATDFCNSPTFLASNGLWAGGAIYNNTSDRALPLSLARNYGSQDLDTIWDSFVNEATMTGTKMVELLRRSFGKGLSVSFMANQVPQKTNHIELHPTITDKWGRPVAYVLKQWHSHDVLLMNVLADQCADILRQGGVTDGLGEGGVYMAENALARCSNHILGGARFGTDPTDSVLDVNCRAWNFDNLYVTDGAFMPTSGGGNPTLTIQANSFRVAEYLATKVL